MRKLHLKLYLSVVGTLIVFMVAGAMIWHHFAPREAMWGVQSAAGVVARVFEAAPPSGVQEDDMLEAMGEQLRADVALYADADVDATPRPLKAYGSPFAVSAEQLAGLGWHMTGRGPIYNRALADGRHLLIRPRQRLLLHGLHLGLMLTGVAVMLALVIYPITRGITARLGRLEASVRALGEGNLGSRVAVEGNDEVAALARSFNESAARVEQLVRAHKLLLANCSHELRTPLARIRMGVEKLGGAESAASAEIARSIGELDTLIGEVLLASRLDAMQRPERDEDVDLLALVAEEAAHFGCEPVGEPVHVRGDPTLLRRLVRNLLDNARRHAGGVTRLEVGRAAGNKIMLVVEDDGAGVPPGEREGIFEPFQRTAASPESRGNGLGLSIVRQVARAHGGEVTCEAAARGARFVVVLPAAG